MDVDSDYLFGNLHGALPETDKTWLKKWIRERSGKMRFFDSSGEIAHSRLVPGFPTEISIGRKPEDERQSELKRRARSDGKPPLDPGKPRSTREPPARGR